MVSQGNGGMLTDSMMIGAGPDGFQYEDIDGVGDEARISTDNAEIWVRVDNLTLNLEYAKRLQKREKEYVLQTLTERQAAAKKVGVALARALAAN